MKDLSEFLKYSNPHAKQGQHLAICITMDGDGQPWTSASKGKPFHYTMPWPLPSIEEIPLGQRKKVTETLAKVLRGEWRGDVYATTALFKLSWFGGGIRRREQDMVAWTGFVADDIGYGDGAKIPQIRWATFDKGPTYAVETSSGCDQWVFMWTTPITLYAEGKDFLIQLDELGLTDPGGRLLVKLHRLPTGINTKAGRDDWVVKLSDAGCGQRHEITPLAKELGMDLSRMNRAANRDGVQSRKVELPAVLQDYSNDDSMRVLSAMLDHGLVDDTAVEAARASEDGKIVLEECPWAAEHTTGAGDAYYSPAGFGNEDWVSQAQFHCYHGHCVDRSAHDVLTTFIERGWIDRHHVNRSLERDPYSMLALMKEHWVHCGAGIVDMRKLNSEALTYQQAMSKWAHLKVEDGLKPNGAVKYSCVVKVWNEDKDKHIVDGRQYAPDQEPVIADWSGTYLNTWSPGFDPAEKKTCSPQVKDLLDFLFNMICPVDENTEYVQNLVKAFFAAKIKRQSYRPPFALVSASSYEGTGRGFLARIVRTLLGNHNVRDLVDNELVDSQWTDHFVKSTLIVVPEMFINTASAQKSPEKVYGRVRQLITEDNIQYNAKYGGQGEAKIHCNLFLCTNYINSIKVTRHDRRFLAVMSNRNPAEKKYREANSKRYGALSNIFSAQRKGHDVSNFFGQALDYFDQVECDYFYTLDRPPVTAGLAAMEKSTRTPVETAAYTICDIGGYWASIMIQAFIESQVTDAGDPRGYMRTAGKVLKGQGFRKHSDRFGDKIQRVWFKAESEAHYPEGVAGRVAALELTIERVRNISRETAEIARRLIQMLQEGVQDH